MTSALLACLHHLAAFIVFAALSAELVLIKGELTVTAARSVLRLDAAYGIFASVLLVVGFLRVFYTEKGAAYYFHSVPFIVKIIAFAIVGLLSIYPTVQFLSWRKALQQQQAPVVTDDKRRTIRLVLHTELTLLVVIILCAALMARGIGFAG